MALYMLDTNAASAAMRGNSAFDERLTSLDPSEWCISSVTRSELRFGVALKPGAMRLQKMVEQFLNVCVTLPWDRDAADRHGALRADLRQRGTPIGAFDEMIAAHALSTGAVLVTDNVKHFEKISGLTVENWLRA